MPCFRHWADRIVKPCLLQDVFFPKSTGSLDVVRGFGGCCSGAVKREWCTMRKVSSCALRGDSTAVVIIACSHATLQLYKAECQVLTCTLTLHASAKQFASCQLSQAWKHSVSYQRMHPKKCFHAQESTPSSRAYNTFRLHSICMSRLLATLLAKST